MPQEELGVALRFLVGVGKLPRGQPPAEGADGSQFSWLKTMADPLVRLATKARPGVVVWDQIDQVGDHAQQGVGGGSEGMLHDPMAQKVGSHQVASRYGT